MTECKNTTDTLSKLGHIHQKDQTTKCGLIIQSRDSFLSLLIFLNFKLEAVLYLCNLHVLSLSTQTRLSVMHEPSLISRSVIYFQFCGDGWVRVV